MTLTSKTQIAHFISCPFQAFNNVAGFRDTLPEEPEDFDLTNSENTATFADPDGDPNVICMLKVMLVEETIYEEEQRCNHVYTEECHDTFVTEMETSLVII